MSSFFELPHIFVVFPPGAGGNFVSGLLTRILNEDLNDLELSSTGNAHANSTDKLNFSDVLSCGLRWDVPKFPDMETKLQYYKAEIEKKHGTDRDIKVSWSHDFSSIQLYKILFPNCKILVITHDSDREKLVALIQQELKNRLDPSGFVFLENDYYLEHWRSALYRFLINMLGTNNETIATEIANNFKDVKYKPLVTFSAIRMMLRSYGLEHLVDFEKTAKINYFDYCFKPRITEDPSYVYKEGDFTFFIIGPSFRDCLTDDCNVMPFDVLMNKNVSAFTSMIEHLIGNLNSNQTEFIRRNLENYHNKQAPMLMENPLEYYSNLVKLAKDQMKSLTTI